MQNEAFCCKWASVVRRKAMWDPLEENRSWCGIEVQHVNTFFLCNELAQVSTAASHLA